MLECVVELLRVTSLDHEERLDLALQFLAMKGAGALPNVVPEVAEVMQFCPFFPDR